MAQVALRASHNVIATSRNPSGDPDAVSAITSNPNGGWLTLDVTASQESITRTIAEAETLFGPVDVLVNNAAYAVLGAAEEVPEEVAREDYETNYWEPLKIIRALLPSMRERKSGTIVNISSIAGMTALPTAAFYSGSKWALEGMLPKKCHCTSMLHAKINDRARLHPVTSMLMPGHSAIRVSRSRTSDVQHSCPAR